MICFKPFLAIFRVQSWLPDDLESLWQNGSKSELHNFSCSGEKCHLYDRPFRFSMIFGIGLIRGFVLSMIKNFVLLFMHSSYICFHWSLTIEIVLIFLMWLLLLLATYSKLIIRDSSSPKIDLCRFAFVPHVYICSQGYLLAKYPVYSSRERPQWCRLPHRRKKWAPPRCLLQLSPSLMVNENPHHSHRLMTEWVREISCTHLAVHIGTKWGFKGARSSFLIRGPWLSRWQQKWI